MCITITLCNGSDDILHNCHNHPSGVSEPSQADIELTRRLKDALWLVDVKVLDHLIIGDGEPLSMAERGLI
ncbi:DNA repair protein RadC [Pseudomonas sp. JUb42]|jgi:DNA repair protein RadC|nr:DNA repair protein RadC [Pseudomonas sp. JUb42]